MSGLKPYEIVLMILGIALFSVLLWEVIKKGFTMTYGAGFLLPLAFIGYPSIKSISFIGEIETVKEEINNVQVDRNDAEAKATLEKKLDAVEDRASSPDDLATISNGYLAIDNQEKAVEKANEVLEKEPDNPKALEVKKVVAVEEQIKQVKENPNDEAAKQALIVQMVALEKIPTQTSNKTVSLANGYFLLNDVIKAKAYVDSTKIIQPANLRIKKISETLSRVTPN